MWYCLLQIGETPFYVSLDHSEKTVVVCVRGTLSLQVGTRKETKPNPSTAEIDIIPESHSRVNTLGRAVPDRDICIYNITSCAWESRLVPAAIGKNLCTSVTSMLESFYPVANVGYLATF